MKIIEYKSKEWKWKKSIFYPSNMKINLGDLQEIARNEMIEMIKRLLLEADLEDQMSKLGVFGKTIEGIKEFLSFLLKDPQTGKNE